MTATTTLDSAADPMDVARVAAGQIAEATGVERHHVALVLGSGWGPAADLLGRTEAQLPAADVAGFSAPVVAGHGGFVRSVAIGDSDRRALVLPRTHLYEGKGVRSVVHGVRTAAAAGCTVMVFTNGCGGLDRSWLPGTPVLIADHLNLTGISPIEGANFIDLTDLYSARLRALCHQVEPDLAEGIYAQFHGPQYETPAEVRMAGVLGATLVGMSTAIEAIAARQAGLEILGLSLVTNLAAGISDRPLDHAEVLEAGRAAAERCGRMLAQVVQQL
jgi:purine-nucleoside phosphorylase